VALRKGLGEQPGPAPAAQSGRHREEQDQGRNQEKRPEYCVGNAAPS
jgi:hypothetical protein